MREQVGHPVDFRFHIGQFLYFQGVEELAKLRSKIVVSMFPEFIKPDRHQRICQTN